MNQLLNCVLHCFIGVLALVSIFCIISVFNPFKPNEFVRSYYLEKSILHFMGVRLTFFFISLT